MAQRKLLGQNLDPEERISLAQLALMPGWKILVRLMAEACREATEEVIKLDPGSADYEKRLTALQTKARAMNKFTADVLDSVQVNQKLALNEVKKDKEPESEESTGRFQGFKFPEVKPRVMESPLPEGAK